MNDEKEPKANMQEVCKFCFEKVIFFLNNDHRLVAVARCGIMHA